MRPLAIFGLLIGVLLSAACEESDKQPDQEFIASFVKLVNENDRAGLRALVHPRVIAAAADDDAEDRIEATIKSYAKNTLPEEVTCKIRAAKPAAVAHMSEKLALPVPWTHNLLFTWKEGAKPRMLLVPVAQDDGTTHLITAWPKPEEAEEDASAR